MRISDLLRMGLRSLLRRKTRTILTVMGVVIGSLLIIIMIAVGEGMDHNFKEQVEEYGSLTTITIYNRGQIYDSDNQWVGSQDQKLDEALLKLIRDMDHVKFATPVITMDASLYSGRLNGWSMITAMEREAFTAFEFPDLIKGEYPSDEDFSQIIFGYQQPYEFYDMYNWRAGPKKIDLDKDKLVLKFSGMFPVSDKKKEFSLPLKNIAKMDETMSYEDYQTFMDLEYFKEIYTKYANTLSFDDRKKAMKKIAEYSEVRLNVDNINNIDKVQEKIKELGYQSESLMTYVKPMMESSKTIQRILLIMAAISMLVSAISIANTMVMSIYERTKEIGIMKVLGCVVRDIRVLFLFEAGMIGFVGGITGTVLGYASTWLINKYGGPIFGALMSQGLGSVSVSTYAIIPFYLPFISMGVSIVVALLSGYFPARRATKIKAIEAMRSEG